MAKKDNQSNELKNSILISVRDILVISDLLKPFMPETAEKIDKIFNAKKIKAPKKPLFPRLD